MHGLSHSTNFTRFLAIDLGKFNSVCCCFDRPRLVQRMRRAVA